MTGAGSISLIICTRDRASQLAEALDRLPHDELARHETELVVVDNGSSDGTAAVIEAHARGAAYRILPVSEQRAGLSHARNAGIAASRGDLILLTDDDCYLDRAYLGNAHRAFADPDLGFCGGRIVLFDPSDDPIATYDHPDPIVYPPRSILRTGQFQGASLSFRRQVWERAGGFDPGLGAGTPFRCEDIEWVARASMAGYLGKYDPDLVVYHHHRRQAPQDVARLVAQNDVARGAFYMAMVLKGHRAYLRPFVGNLLRGVRRGAAGRSWRELSGAVRYLPSGLRQRRP